jgi:PPOX class probable F420-dependent enzyme
MAELPDPVRALLEGPNYVHVATLMGDGAPHSVAMWGGLEGDRIAVYTQKGSLKARNLERDGRVAISVTGHENPYRTAQIRGRVAETRDGDAAGAIMDRLSLRYTGQPWRMHGPGAIAYLIEPDRVRYTELPLTHSPG